MLRILHLIGYMAITGRIKSVRIVRSNHRPRFTIYVEPRRKEA